MAVHIATALVVLFSDCYDNTAAAQVANFGSFYIPAGANVGMHATFANHASASFVNDGNASFAGDITNDQPAPAPGNGITLLTGAALQTIGGAQPFYAHHLTLNKAGYTQLDVSLFVSGVFTLTNGILNTAGNKLLVLQGTASIAGSPGENSFVSGPMQWQTNQTRRYDFPVGKTTPYIQYQPMGVLVETLAGTTGFTTEYVAANPMATPFGSLFVDPGLAGMYNHQYWTVSRNGDATARVILPYNGNPGNSYWTPVAPIAKSNVAVTMWQPAAVPSPENPGFWKFTKPAYDFDGQDIIARRSLL